MAASTAGNVTLGLTAHQRYDNPALTNDGNGTFRAGPGCPIRSPSARWMRRCRWNVGYAILGDADLNDYLYRFIYDTDPGAGNSASVFDIVFGASAAQDSWNLGMDHFNFPAFDANAAGTYDFALVAYNQDGLVAARSDIRVNIPEPASLALVGIALAGLAASRRRKA